jgi:hypothetical protein
MDLLRTAVVDITTLVVTGHALMSRPAEGDDLAKRRKLRARLRREIERATVAYIDVLARTKRGVLDDVVLGACRVAAERQMPRAMECRDLLSGIMLSEPGSLDGFAAARQDLWRLAHMTIYLRLGVATLRESGASGDAKLAGSLARRLRRRLRKALVAYARATLRTKESRGPQIVAARRAALVEIGQRGAAEAERLADIEAGGDPSHTVLRLGVTRPLLDLALDWGSQSEPN